MLNDRPTYDLHDPIQKSALVTVRDGKLLVARSYGKDTFYVPGGKIETDETAEQALEREVQEELATKLVEESAVELGVFTGQAHGKREGKQVNLHAFAAVLEGSPQASEEIEELRWVGAAEAEQVSSAGQLILADLAKKSVVTGAANSRRAVLFDLGDTLFLTREVKWEHHRFVAKDSFGIDLTDEELTEHWGKPFEEMIALLYGGLGTPEERLEANKASNERFPKKPIDGALDAVNELLDRGIAVGIITSTVTERAVAELTRHGYPMDRLLLVQGADLTDFHKPDSRVFGRASKLLKALGKTEVTYVGDALTDEQAALDAGFNFVAVTTGLFEADDFSSRSTVLSDLKNLPELFA
ncbi:HAD-IA family hydrolase [Rothia terrae]|uniref:HAD-IA family hydrolase n=1 Tax=Rothia terrae TaxID=396015 RepID=UPI003811ECBB